jgi:hypothetical protein
MDLTEDHVVTTTFQIEACTGEGCSQAVLEYGFEDWGGSSIESVPLYPFSTAYEEYCQVHESITEVVTAYDGIIAHGGDFFFVQNDANSVPLDPSIDGITGEGCRAISMQGNFSASHPESEAWHALDDIRIYDSFPPRPTYAL